MKTAKNFVDERAIPYGRSLFIAPVLLAGLAVFAVGLSVTNVEAQTGNPGRLVTSKGDGGGGVIEFNTDGTNTVNLTAHPADGACHSDIPAYNDHHPTVSRDGRLIAFQSNRDPGSAGKARIFVMNSDGTNIRQLTFNVPSGEFQANEVRDDVPVISPDGSRIAFISNRSVYSYTSNGCPSGCQYRPNDVYVVNTDGTSTVPLQVTQFQPNPAPSGAVGSNVVSVVWNPDGTRLAFRGTRLVSQVLRFVVGTINANGSSEAILDDFSTTGQSSALDWSPNGRYIGLIWGGEAQGAPPIRVRIYDLQTAGFSDLLQGENLISQSGGIRFSPDSARFVVSITTDFNFGTGVFAFFNVNGSGRTDTPRPVNNPLWWQGGAAIQTPTRLELIPNPVVVRSAGPKVLMYPTLFDALGNVIVRAATAWRFGVNGCFGNSASINYAGQVTASGAGTYTDQVCASNGGQSACADLFVNPATNKIDEPEFLVRDHYADFLGRAGDQSGINFWTNEITSCGSNQQCLEVKRINVSASFFLSIEFQQTGYLVERIYKAAFGDTTGTSTFNGTHQISVPIVRFNELLTDTQQIDQGVVVLQTGWEQQLENNKQAFTAQFVNRARFVNGFPATMTPAQFVDKLFLNAGVTPSTSDRNAVIAEFGSATNTSDSAARSRALRKVAENSTFAQQEFNRAFVLMQYMGYLRRNANDTPDADYSGYDFWLTKLNQFNGNYINAEMVKAFLSSIEYRKRFGP